MGLMTQPAQSHVPASMGLMSQPLQPESIVLGILEVHVPLTCKMSWDVLALRLNNQLMLQMLTLQGEMLDHIIIYWVSMTTTPTHRYFSLLL